MRIRMSTGTTANEAGDAQGACDRNWGRSEGGNDLNEQKDVNTVVYQARALNENFVS